MKENLVYVGKHVVGQVIRGTFYKAVSGKLHFLRNPPAICSDKSALADAVRYGATKMIVTDKDTGTRYFATVATIHKYGFTVNRGAGEQVGLTLNRWTVLSTQENQDD